MSKESVLGLVGLARGGKTEARRHLETKYGYKSLRPGDHIRDVLREREGNREFTRTEVSQMGNELRRLHGPDFFLQGIASVSSCRVAIDGVRNAVAAEKIVASHEGTLIGFVAQAHIRHQRGWSATDGKPLVQSLDDFLAEEVSELRSLDRNGLQILTVLMKVRPDYIIDTSALTILEAHTQLDYILEDLGVCPTPTP